jgi:hypothetical protein
MEVDLQLVAKIDTLFADMKKLKDNLVDVDKTTVSISKNLSTAFKGPTQDINNLITGTKGATTALSGFDQMLTQLQNSQGPEELLSNFEKLVLEAKKSLPPLEALEFQLKALQSIRPFVDDVGTLDAVDKRVKQIETEMTKLKNIKVDTNTVSLRTQLQNAKNEVAKLAEELGPLAPATLLAAKNAGELQHQFKEVQAITNALNPAAKFEAIAALGQGIAGTFEIATGALGLFGAKSEEVEKLLLKVQSAVAFARGLDELIKLREELTNIAAVVKVWFAEQTAVNAAVEVNTESVAANAAATEADVAAQQQLSLAFEEQAVAGDQMALAMDVETVSVEASGVAAEGAAASTGLLTTAIEVLTGPVGIIIGSLGILIGLVFAFSRESEEAKIDVDALVKSLNDFHDAIEFVNGVRRDQIENAAKISTAQAKDNADKILQIEKEKNLKLRDLDEDLLKTQSTNIKKLLKARAEASHDDTEEGKKRLEKINEQLKAEQSISDRLIKDIHATFIADELAQIEHDKKMEELRQRFAKQLKDDNDKLLKLQVEREADLAQLFNGQTRIDLERDATEKAILAKRQGIIDEGKAEIDQAKITYGEASTELAAIRANVRKRIEQADENAQIESLAAAKKFTEDSIKNLVANELLKNQLITDLQKRALADFITNFQTRERAILESDLSIAEKEKLIEQERAKGVLEINDKFTQDYLDQQKEFETNKLDAIDGSGQRQIDFEKDIAIKKLEVNIKYDELQIQRAKATAAALTAINPNFDTSALDLTISKLEADLQKNRAAIKEIQEQVEPFSWADLLGLKLSKTQEQQFNDSANSIIKSATDIYGQIIQLRQAEVEAQIAADEAVINSSEKKISELQKDLDQELKLNELGFASNVETTRKALAEQKALRDKALADKQKLVKQEQALAKQEAIIGAIQQAASLGTASAKLLDLGASTGPVGIAVAVATIAGMIASFLSFIAQIKKATSIQTLGDGGWIKGKAHSAGGVDVNAEHDEFMMRRYVATKHPDAMEAINDEDWQNVPDSFLIPILRARGIRLSRESADRIMNDHVKVANAEASAPARLDKLERLHGETNEHLKHIRNKINDQEERTFLPDGSTKIVKGNKTVIIRP